MEKNKEQNKEEQSVVPEKEEELEEDHKASLYSEIMDENDYLRGYSEGVIATLEHCFCDDCIKKMQEKK